MDEDERIEQAGDAVEIEAYAVEAAVLLVIAERLGSIEPGDTVADALSHAPEDMKRAEKILETGAKDLSRATFASFDAMADMNDVWSKPFYAANMVEPTALAREHVTMAAEAAIERVGGFLRTSVVGLAGPDGTGFVPLRRAYVDIVGNAASAMARGEIDYVKAVGKAVSRLGGGGLRVQYESGATRELYGAVRQNVMDSYRLELSESRKIMGEEFGADGVEVSAHAPCAPDHVKFQGRQFSEKRFEEIQASLERPIAEGYNCRHVLWPIVLGISQPAYSDGELRTMADESAEKVTFTGLNGEPLTMTRYEATQYQRKLERELRSSKLDAKMAESAGIDPKPARARSRAVSKAYRTMSEEAGLVAKPERARLYLPR